MNAAFGGNGYGKLTANANTVIQFLIPSRTDGVTRVTRVDYTPGNTAHTLTFLRPIGRTTATAASAANTNTVTLGVDPGPSGNGIAANDFVAIRETDSVTRSYKVSAWNANTLVVTLTANLTAGVASGGKVWNFGASGDTDPVTGLAHPALATVANTNLVATDSDSGVVAGLTADDPILFNSDNGTAAGTLNRLGWTYTVK